MIFNEKLNEIEKTSKKWLKLKKKYSNEDLQHFVKKYKNTLLKLKIKEIFKKCLEILKVTIIILCVLNRTEYSKYVGCLTDFGNHCGLLITAVVRYALVHSVFHVVNYHILDHDCFMYNPLYDHYHIDESVCSCVDFDLIPQINYGVLSKLELSTQYIDKRKPVVIRTSLEREGWLSNSNRKVFEDLSTLLTFYQKYSVFKKGHVCGLKTNIQIDGQSGHVNLIQKMMENYQNKSWYAFWRHCGKQQTKAFREAFNRPDFLGDDIELTSGAWILFSQKIKIKKLFDFNNGKDIVAIICQMKGKFELLLTPREDCSNLCGEEPFSVVLQAGDCLLASDRVYTIDVVSESTPDLNIAILLPASTGELN